MFSKIKDVFSQVKDEYLFNLKVVTNNFSTSFNGLFVDREFFDTDFFEDLEEKLIELDILPSIAILITQQMESSILNQKISKDKFNEEFFNIINEVVKFKEENLILSKNKLNVLLVIGVNGVGKTTTISKLTNMYKKDYKILLTAADTFRAGAIEQLNMWAKRLNVDIIKTHQGHAPSAVMYNSIDFVNKNEDIQLLICDTAGRLHNKSDLMEELKKIDTVIQKNLNCDFEKKNILILDGTSGKNTLEQAKVFNEICLLDGIIVTKVDTNFKVGLIINIAYELQIPIYFMTTGEQLEDITKFNYNDYLQLLFKNK